MATEIERKFLVKMDAWVPMGPGVRMTQGYLSSHKDRVVRVRLEGDRAALTIKGPTRGIVRQEFEYPIPTADAPGLLALCEQPLIDKHRHVEVHDGCRWEIDVFHGDNDGLVIAEIELPTESTLVTMPRWIGEEVSGDPRYFNSNLLSQPYSTWKRG